MAYEIEVTVTVTVRKPSTGYVNRERTGATLSQTVTRTTGGPNERYWYTEAEQGAADATADVLKMMEGAYGRASKRALSR
jgi:hypothetical protein